MSSPKFPPIYTQILKKSFLLKDLSGLELEAVTAFLKPLRIRSGELLFNEGAAGEEMFVLISGKIDAFVNQVDGTQRWIFEFNPGDFLGEMAIIANESRTATLYAKVDTDLVALHAVDFYRIVFDYPMIGQKILKVIRNVQNTWLEQTSKHLGDIMRWGEAARRRAVTDELTGLYNRRFLEESASERFEKGAVRLRTLSLLMLDLDKIHEINTRHGTRAGDLVFISAAEILRSNTRTGDICARLAGDEFSILLPDTGPQEARGIAEKIRQSIASRQITVPLTADGRGQTKVSVCTSVGIASAPVHSDNWEGLQQAADSALRRSKELGRNRVEIAGKQTSRTVTALR